MADEITAHVVTRLDDVDDCRRLVAGRAKVWAKLMDNPAMWDGSVMDPHLKFVQAQLLEAVAMLRAAEAK